MASLTNKIIKLSIILLFSASISFGDVNSDKVISDNSLQSCVSYALLNNPQLSVSFAKWKASLEQVPQAKALSDPKFTFGYFINEVETKVGPQRARVGIVQQFPWFGKLKDRADMAFSQSEAARFRFEYEKLSLAHKVKDQWYEYAFLGKSLELAKENLELVKYYENVARSKYESAIAGHPDIIRAQIELAVISDIVESLENYRSPQAHKLYAIMNLPDGHDIDMPSLPTDEGAIDLDRGKVFDLVLNGNPLLAELHNNIEAGKSGLALANSQSTPDIALGLDWIDTGNADMDVDDSGKDPLVVMFSVNLPIWAEKNKAVRRQAVHGLHAAEMEKVNRENLLLAQADELIYKIEDSRRKMKLYRDVLGAKVSELVKVSETSYRNGTTDFLALIDAQRMQLKYKLDYYRAYTDYLKNIAALEVLTAGEMAIVD